MEDFPKIEWSALEYEERERTRDWFWALGIIIATASIAAVIFGNYFFAGLIILGGVVLGIFATKKPEVVNYTLDEHGFWARGNLYHFESIHAFWVETKEKPQFFIKSSRIFVPIISVPIDPASAGSIRDIMLRKEIPEEKMEEHLAEKIMEVFGL